MEVGNKWRCMDIMSATNQNILINVWLFNLISHYTDRLREEHLQEYNLSMY